MSNHIPSVMTTNDYLCDVILCIQGKAIFTRLALGLQCALVALDWLLFEYILREVVVGRTDVCVAQLVEHTDYR